MSTEIIKNPNGTFAVYDGNRLVSDGWQTKDFAETSAAAAALGKKGGSVKSDKKAAAVRENGRKGGRPRGRRLETSEPLEVRHVKGLLWSVAGVESGTIYETSQDVGSLKRLMNRTHRPPSAMSKTPGVWYVK